MEGSLEAPMIVTVLVEVRAEGEAMEMLAGTAGAAD